MSRQRSQLPPSGAALPASIPATATLPARVGFSSPLQPHAGTLAYPVPQRPLQGFAGGLLFGSAIALTPLLLPLPGDATSAGVWPQIWAALSIWLYPALMLVTGQRRLVWAGGAALLLGALALMLLPALHAALAIEAVHFLFAAVWLLQPRPPRPTLAAFWLGWHASLALLIGRF